LSAQQDSLSQTALSSGTSAKSPTAGTERPAAGAGLYALIALMIAGWTGNFVAGKIALRTFPPLLLNGLRVSIAGILMIGVFGWVGRRRPARSYSLRDVGQLVVLGVFGVALNQFLFVLGLSRTSVAHASIFANTTPILILVMATLLGLERLTGSRLAGLTMALSGVVLLRLFDTSPHAEATFAGDFLTFCGAMAFSMFTVLGKTQTRRYGTITVNMVAYVGGALLILPVTIWQAAGFDFRGVTVSGWAAVLYMALVPSVICYLIYYYALARMEASRLAAYSYLQPVLAILFGILILHEHVTAVLLVSAAIIFGGVYLTQRES
jgi:drug/metabolite transporter (DMT)-like permease